MFQNQFHCTRRKRITLLEAHLHVEQKFIGRLKFSVELWLASLLFVAPPRSKSLKTHNKIIQTYFLFLEYVRLRSQWKADTWLRTFLVDAALYQGSYEQKALLQPRRPEENSRAGPIVAELGRLTWFYHMADDIVSTLFQRKFRTRVGVLRVPGIPFPPRLRP